MNAGRSWALCGFLLGVLVSVAGNVGHVWYRPGELAPAPLGAMLAAAFWPIALLVTIEVLARVDWPRSLSWGAVRVGGAGLVAAVAAIVSYRHMSGLLEAFGEDRVTALIGPLAVDGLMVVCGLALLATGRDRVKGSELSRTLDDASAQASYLATAVPDGVDGSPVGELGGPVGLEWWDAIEAGAPEFATVNLTDATGDEGALLPVATADPLLGTARDRYADLLATGALPSVRALRADLRVGHPRAVRIRTAIAQETS